MLADTIQQLREVIRETKPRGEIERTWLIEADYEAGILIRDANDPQYDQDKLNRRVRAWITRLNEAGVFGDHSKHERI